MPNGKFPREAAKQLGIASEQLAPSLVVEKIGNTYSGSSLLGLCAVLDIAKPGERILLTSFGSGAGADSFSFVVADAMTGKGKAPLIKDYIEKRQYIEYAVYARMREKLKV